MSQSVVYQEQAASNNKRIGMARLNQENTLNALSLDMVKSLKGQLELWKADTDIVCVFLEGTGSKAFCAGGDVQALYQSAIETPGGPCLLAEEFFDIEYRLDYLLHTYPKPIVCWGHGIVMGGGLGLMAGCSHAVVTEKTRVAMPEITIGLYPDVGGSWFLNAMPGKAGLFLALTGASINANDCLFTGLSKHALSSELYDELLTALNDFPWAEAGEQNSVFVSELLDGFAQKSSDAMPDGNLQPSKQKIDELCASDQAASVIKNIMSMETDNPWLLKAKNSLVAGSPLSALIIHNQLQRTSGLSLADVFKAEYMLSTNIIRYPEFAEGVRALLIDKDRNPQWQFKTIEEVSLDRLDQFFAPPQSGSTWPENPLADLGA